MNFSFVFLINSILLGIGLAMDAFSVSMANGLREPDMNKTCMNLIAGTFAFFQFAMPMVGWICVHTIVEKFNSFQKFIPYIALILLLYIGGEMLIDAFKQDYEDEEVDTLQKGKIAFSKLMIQGIATSIDALSVGFTISSYNTTMALLASLIIAVVTFAICYSGIIIGKKFGTKLSNKASILGGVILIGIGIEICVKGVFF